MKTIQRLLPLLSVVILLFCQSCTVTGLLIGKSKRTNDLEAAKSPILEAKGWVEPASTKYDVNLTLLNDSVVHGRYLGKDYFWDGNQTIELVLYEDRKHEKSVAVTNIKNTRIYIRPKKSARNGALVGGAVDVAWITLVILTGDMGYNWNFNLMGN